MMLFKLLKNTCRKLRDFIKMRNTIWNNKFLSFSKTFKFHIKTWLAWEILWLSWRAINLHLSSHHWGPIFPIQSLIPRQPIQGSTRCNHLINTSLFKTWIQHKNLCNHQQWGLKSQKISFKHKYGRSLGRMEKAKIDGSRMRLHPITMETILI